MDSENTLKPGTILESEDGKYKIVKVLGQGGFGITYLVTGEVKVGNVTTEVKFAIKEHFPDCAEREGNQVKPKAGKDDDFQSNKNDFIAEARKLHALGTENENIVKVNEVFESNGTAYYVMQYINGESLYSYVKKNGKIKYNEAIDLLSPIMDAVEFLHKSRINHMDIKPENIMLHNGIDGIVPILIDFGLSVHFKKNGNKTTKKSIQGVTEGYSPLEQYASIKEFIPGLDIYSLMATLLFCLTGKDPQSAAEIKLSDVRATLERSVPPTSIEGICNGLKKSYEDRTSSISILKSELGLSNTEGGRKTRVIGIEKEKNNSKTIILIVICIAIVIGIVLFFYLKADNKTNGSQQAIASADTSAIIPDESTENQSTPLPGPTELTESNSQDQRESVSVEDPTPTQPSPTQSSQASETSVSTVSPAPAKPAAKPETSTRTSGTLSLGYGIWEGGIKNNKADGKGKITFNAPHRVDRSTSYEANPGDYFIATYDNGNLISGKLYDSEGNLLKTIIP